MEVHFRKYHGFGNDYLVIDPHVHDVDLTPGGIRLVCDRNFGIGADGILYGPIKGGEKLSLRIFNPDGSEAEKSGDGSRIFTSLGCFQDYNMLFSAPLLAFCLPWRFVV